MPAYRKFVANYTVLIVFVWRCVSNDDESALQLSSTSSTQNVNCQPQWIRYPHKGAHGGRRIQKAAKLQQCKTACFVNPMCFYVDWVLNENPKQCWIHEGHRQRFYRYGTTQLQIVRQCRPTTGRTTSRVIRFGRLQFLEGTLFHSTAI